MAWRESWRLPSARVGARAFAAFERCVPKMRVFCRAARLISLRVFVPPLKLLLAFDTGANDERRLKAAREQQAAPNEQLAASVRSSLAYAHRAGRRRLRSRSPARSLARSHALIGSRDELKLVAGGDA